MTNCRYENILPGARRGRAVIFGLMLILLAAASSMAQTGPLDDLFVLKNRKTARISSADVTGGNSDWMVFKPGETKTLAEISGAGVIRRFYVAPLAADRMRYRKVLLRMYWDGETSPSVEVPLGDFFGSGLGTLRYFHSAIVDINRGMSGRDFDGLVNYFPMPFAKGARITLENDGQVDNFRMWYHIDYEQYPEGLPADSGRFHAQWRHVIAAPASKSSPKNTTLGNAAAKNLTGEENFLILDARGRGTYVGLFLTVDNVIGQWYGEGDDMIYVDGATSPPTYAGTGHEEVFNAGCCPDIEFWGPYTGFYLIENRKGDFSGKNQMYKFYVNDPIRFEKSIRVTIEHGHANNFENDYTSTAFWYQQEPHAPFPAMPAAEARLPRWPDGVGEAMAKELQLGPQLMRALRPQAGRQSRLTPEDRKKLMVLSGERTKAFQELRWPDYIRGVGELDALVKRYAEGAPPAP